MAVTSLRSRALLPGEGSWLTRRDGLPLVIEPARRVSAESLTAVIRDQRGLVLSQLTSHGAILFRNTPYVDPTQFMEVMKALGLDYGEYPYLTDNYRRAIVKGVVNASSTAAALPVPPHTEQAFSCVRPGIVGFMCLQRPAQGGQTPLHDCVAIYKELAPSTRDALRYAFFCKATANMTEGGLESNFNTLDCAKIDRICERFGVERSWKDGKLSFITKGPCVVTHPLTGETAFSCFWTIPALHYFFRHYHALPGANRVLGLICRCTPLPVFDLACRYCHPFFRNNYRYYFMKDDESLRVPLAMHTEINAAIWRNTTVFEWQHGDILLIDNIKTGHSRMPFVPPRNVVASVCSYYDAREEKYRAPEGREGSK